MRTIRFPAMAAAICVCLFVTTSIAFAQPTAKEVVQTADAKMRGSSSTAAITIQIVRPTWKREIEMRTWSKGNKLAMVYIDAPARNKGTVFLKRDKEVWNWIPTIERSIKLPPSMMSQSWMGTDFTNDDLVKEFSIVEDYNHGFATDETIEGRNCYVVVLTPLPQAAVVWGKIKLWIDKKDFLQLKGEYYDETGALVNIMTGRDIKLLGGKILPSVLEMIPVDKQGNKTVMIYKQLSFDQPIAESFFSVENMKKLK